MTMNQEENRLLEHRLEEVLRRLPEEERKKTEASLREKIRQIAEETGSLHEALRILDEDIALQGNSEKSSDPAEASPSEESKKTPFPERTADSVTVEKTPDRTKKRDLRLSRRIALSLHDSYFWFLRVSLLSSALSIFAVRLIEELVGDPALLPGASGVGKIVGITLLALGRALLGALVASLTVFLAVTLLFLLLGRKQPASAARDGVSPDAPSFSSRSKKHTPGKDASKAVIRRSEIVAGVVFTVILGVILLFAPDFFSVVFRQKNAIAQVPLFNLSYWNRLVPLLCLALLAALAEKIFRLIVGRWCMPVFFFSLAANAVRLVAAVVILKFFPLWNESLASDLQIQLGLLPESAYLFLTRWNPALASNLILAFLVLIFLLDLAITLYKTLRYSEKRKKKTAFS